VCKNFKLVDLLYTDFSTGTKIAIESVLILIATDAGKIEEGEKSFLVK